MWRRLVVAVVLTAVVTTLAEPADHAKSGQLLRRKLASSMKFMGKKPSASTKARQAKARHETTVQPVRSSQCSDSSTRARPGAMCAKGQGQAFVRLVHIPKAGGMSLSCTFQAPRHESLCKKHMQDRLHGMNHSFQGHRHETYFQIKEQQKCSGEVYSR